VSRDVDGVGLVSRVDLKVAGLIALVTGVGGFVLAVVGALVATSADSATAGQATRAVLVTALLVLAGGALGNRASGAPTATAAVGLLAGYALTLGWFNGRTYAAGLVVDSVPLAAVLDLVLWLVVGLAAGRLATSRR
jgi:hypothetical protein